MLSFRHYRNPIFICDISFEVACVYLDKKIHFNTIFMPTVKVLNLESYPCFEYYWVTLLILATIRLTEYQIEILRFDSLEYVKLKGTRKSKRSCIKVQSSILEVPTFEQFCRLSFWSMQYFFIEIFQSAVYTLMSDNCL